MRIRAIEMVEERLKKCPGLAYEIEDDRVSVKASTDSGFSVWMVADKDGYTVGYDGWHEIFRDEGEALNCFVFGLSDHCRLRVVKRGKTECSWTVEGWDGEAWVQDSTTGVALVPFWRRKTVEYRQNDVITVSGEADLRVCGENMVPEFEVVVADVSHVDVLSEIGTETFIEAYQVTLSAEDLEAYVEEAFSKEVIRDEIERGRSYYLLCIDREGWVCGYSKHMATDPPPCVAREGVIELQRLYVRDSYRGQGIGGLLARGGEAIARDKGFAGIWLQVWEGNATAQQVYLNWGYSFCGEQMYTVGGEERKVMIMSKMLGCDG